MNWRKACLSISSLLLLLAPAASAVDGVIELNQTCALTTGCLPGDTPGYPILISDTAGPRSFRLTSDLVVSSISVTAVDVRVGDVTINLGGFAIIRNGCLGATSSCIEQGSGNGVGIFQPGSGNDIGLTVRNGSIVGMGSDGIRARDQANIRNVKVRWNGGIGIRAGQGAVIENCQARQNGSRGIEAGAGSTLTRNSAVDNVGDGFFASFAATLENNTAYLNDGDGIQVGANCTLRGNVASNNDGNGILSSQGSAIVENTSSSNGQSGIRASFGLHRIQGNSVNFNDDYGLRLASSSDVYSENRIGSNTPGAVLSGTNLGGNYCTGAGVGSSSCP